MMTRARSVPAFAGEVAPVGGPITTAVITPSGRKPRRRMAPRRSPADSATQPFWRPGTPSAARGLSGGTWSDEPLAVLGGWRTKVASTITNRRARRCPVDDRKMLCPCPQLWAEMRIVPPTSGVPKCHPDPLGSLNLPQSLVAKWQRWARRGRKPGSGRPVPGSAGKVTPGGDLVEGVAGGDALEVGATGPGQGKYTGEVNEKHPIPDRAGKAGPRRGAVPISVQCGPPVRRSHSRWMTFAGPRGGAAKPNTGGEETARAAARLAPGLSVV